MDKIKIYENPAFGRIRTAGTSEEPLFCLADVCRAVELTNPSSVKGRLEAEDVQLIDLHALNGGAEDLVGNTMATFVTESGFYDVLLFSSSSKVKPFRKWITHDILPSIRKTGFYGLPRTFAEALRLAADQQERLEEQRRLLDEQKPKVEFFDAVAESKTAIEMKAVANTLHFKGVGRNKLFAILREKKILMGNNMPYQRYVDCGYFRPVEQKYATPDGEVRVSIKTIVYQKGVDFIRKTLKGMGLKEAEEAA